MKMRWVFAALALQLAVLLIMAVPREWALHFGKVVLLRTAPVDPRDVMRGDYVRLNYDISTVPRERCRDGLAAAMAGNPPDSQKRWRVRGAWGGGFDQSLLPPDTEVYAVLKPGRDGTAELDYLTDRKPAEGLYIRGRLESLDEGLARVRYGLEAYFMQQGDALELERSQAGTTSRAPLDMAVAIGHGGLAVLKGHQRGPLEIGLDLQRQRRGLGPAPGVPNEVVVGATIRLRNASATNLAIVALPDARSFALVPDFRWGTNDWRWVGANLPPPAPVPTNVILLKPGEIHRTTISLTNSAWWVAPQSAPASNVARAQPVDSLNNRWPPTRFRFEYRPPAPEACAGLPDAPSIWHGRLLSPAFAPGGNVD
jgi:uncharacterized membrane-anchored protein